MSRPHSKVASGQNDGSPPSAPMENAATLPAVVLNADALDRLYPFHLFIDQSFQVVGCGRVIRRLLPSLCDHPPLERVFTIERPGGIRSLKDLLRARDQTLLLQATERPSLKLKGEIFPLPDGDHAVLMTVPWITDASLLEEFDLMVSDFAISDATPDLMFLVDTQAALLHDAERLTDRLKAARDEAISASQAKSEFLANMSHELRTPLNAIIGFSDYLLMLGTEAPPERFLDYIRDIHSSGCYLLDIINDLLDLARIESGKLSLDESVFDLVDLLRETTRSMTPQAMESSVAIDHTESLTRVMVRADRRLIRQIVLNLLSNAIKFTGEGGSVTATIRRLPDDGLEIEIADTGIGVDPAIIPELFQPFRQANSRIARSYGGTGLGLAIVRKLASLHDGNVTMESTPGNGTCVTVHLPAARFVAEHATP